MAKCPDTGTNAHNWTDVGASQDGSWQACTCGKKRQVATKARTIKTNVKKSPLDKDGKVSPFNIFKGKKK